MDLQCIMSSIATVIAMASEKIVMDTGSLFLIHKPLCMTYGNADDLQETIETLDKTEESILDIYENFSNLSRDELKEVMKEGKAMNGQEASKIFKNIVVEDTTEEDEDEDEDEEKTKKEQEQYDVDLAITLA